MANVLKPTALPPGVTASTFERFNWEDVLVKAREHLADVRRQASEMVAAAKAECDAIKAAAAASGTAEATAAIEQMADKKAQQLADQRIKDAVAAVEQLGRQLDETAGGWLRQWQHETIPLAIAIAERLVRRQVDLEPEVLLGWISESIAMIRTASPVTVRLHPADHSRLQPHLPKLQSAGREVVFAADPAVPPAGVIAESDDCSIDASLATQLERLVEEMN